MQSMLLNRMLLAGPAAVLACGIALAPSSVLAQAKLAPVDPSAYLRAGPRRIVVMAVGIDRQAQGELGRLEHLAEQAVVRSGRFELVRLVEALDHSNTKLRQARVAEAAAAASAAQKLYDDLDAQKAAQGFSEAVKGFRQADLTRHFSDLSQAWTMKIASLVANGETRAAQNEIEKLVAVDPKAQFSPNYFPADTLKQVEDVRRHAASVKNLVQVKTSPPGAQVYLDGLFRCVAPCAVTGLARGDHFLSLVLAGFALSQQAATPGLNEVVLREAESAARYRGLVEQVVKDPYGPGRDGAARQLGEWVKADQVLVAVARKSAAGQKLELIWVRLETPDGHNLAYQELEVPMGEGLNAAAEGGVASLLERDVPMRGTPVTHFSKPGAASMKKTVGYALLGAGVALIGVGTYFGLQANAQAGLFRETPQVKLEADQIKSKGQGFALTADLFFLGGLAAATPGALLAFREGGSAPPAQHKADPKPSPQKKSDPEDLRNH